MEVLLTAQVIQCTYQGDTTNKSCASSIEALLCVTQGNRHSTQLTVLLQNTGYKPADTHHKHVHKLHIIDFLQMFLHLVLDNLLFPLLVLVLAITLLCGRYSSPDTLQSTFCKHCQRKRCDGGACQYYACMLGGTSTVAVVLRPLSETQRARAQSR